MTEDLVGRAARVARDRHDGSRESAQHTETRILFALQARSKRRSRLPLIAVPLVAALLASTAFGTTAGARLRAQLTSSVQSLFGTTAAKPGVPGPSRAAPAPQVAGAVAPEAAPEPPALAPPAVLAARATPKLRAASSASALAVVVAPPAPSVSDADIAALYRAAHRAQFAGSDPAHALELWDRYLSAAPNGSLSPEARYNRAITLIRLGRKSEAAQALAPFARGDYGTYRQSEARALQTTLAQ